MSNHSMQIIPDNVDIFSNFLEQKFNGINTFDNWHLMPTSRIVFSPPAPKTNYIDLSGANGSIDATEALTPYPVYSDRTGSIEFYVLNGKSILSENRRDQTWSKYGVWNSRYSEIMDYMHGRKVKVILDDDREYFYRGRLSVNQWKSDKTWSKITFDYTFEPYKYEILSSLDDWLWDPFSFIDGVVRRRQDFEFTVGPEDTVHYVRIPNRSMPITPRFIFQATKLVSGKADVRIANYDPADDPADDPIPIKQRSVLLTDTQPHSYRFYDVELLEGMNVIGINIPSDGEAPGSEVKVQIDFRGGRL